MTDDLRERIAAALGAEVRGTQPLGGGQIGRVLRVDLGSGERAVAKTADGIDLTIEAAMLADLADDGTLPVPAVLHAEPDLLLLEFVAGETGAGERAARHAGELFARLHARPAPAFGYERPTLLGPFVQDAGPTSDWPAVYAARLHAMRAEAASRGRLPGALGRRVEALADALPPMLEHAPTPALIHGDVWNGNVLSRGGRIAALLDPAVRWADPEVELAFIELFGTFGRAFFEVYEAERPLAAEYREWRRDLYQLYPLLVHVALFGGGYARGVEERVGRLERRFGIA